MNLQKNGLTNYRQHKRVEYLTKWWSKAVKPTKPMVPDATTKHSDSHATLPRPAIHAHAR